MEHDEKIERGDTVVVRNVHETKVHDGGGTVGIFHREGQVISIANGKNGLHYQVKDKWGDTGWFGAKDICAKLP